MTGCGSLLTGPLRVAYRRVKPLMHRSSVRVAAEFRVLGPLEVELRGRPVDLGGARLKTLLAALVLRANETVSSDDLIEALWGEDPPATAANAVHVQISRLRKLLGPGRVATAPRGY